MNATVMTNDGRAFVASILRELFTTKRVQAVADWCCENLRFAEPGNSGPFNLIGREYSREPLDSFGDRTITDQTAVFGSQAGKTGIIMGGMGWSVANEKTRCLWATPSTRFGQKFAKTRWIPMLEASPGTRNLIPRGRRRHLFTTDQQLLDGSIVDLVGSNSAANLAGNPCDRTIGDETDKFAEATAKEADALYLLGQRTKDASQPQRTLCSTPTLLTGPIWQSLLKSDFRRRWLPCPHCGEFVVLVWSRQLTCLPETGADAEMHWDKEAKRPVRLPGAGAAAVWDLARVERSARMVCPHCAGHIESRHKFKLDEQGEYRASQPGTPGHRGWHLSSLYANSPETTFGKLAVKFLEVKYDIGRNLQGFINGELAEPYVNQDTRRERIEVVASKLESGNRKVEIEEEAFNRLMTVDVQGKAPWFWHVVREFKGGDSLGLSAHELDTWEEVEAVQRHYGVRDEHVLIDSGFGARSDAQVYLECVKRCEIVDGMAIGWMPAKGFPAAKKWRQTDERGNAVYLPWYTRQVDPFAGKSEAGRVVLDLFEFSGEFFKDVLENLRQGEGGYTWAIHPQIGTGMRDDVDNTQATATYWEHLDAEQKKEWFNRKTGKTEYSWRPRYDKADNHLMDCEVQMLALAYYLGLFPMGELAHETHEEHETESKAES